MTPVDDAGRPVRPAMTWLDSRASAEAEQLEAATGLRGWALGVLPAARWLERHEPEAAARACWYLNSWEALALRMTGVAATTVVPGGAGLPREALAGSGLGLERLAADVTSGTAIGALTTDAAHHLGLKAGTPVVAGLVDAFASFHGAGMQAAGDAIDVGGSAGGFGVYADRPVQVAGGFTTPAPMPGLYSVGGAMAATGAALDWFGSEILNGSVPVTELLAEAGRVEPGAEGLIFLPYLAGERSPLWDPTARGAFAGLTLRHTRGHMVRAILEAAAFAIRHVAAPMLAAGIHVTAMRACGGPARDAGWSQIKADVTGFRVAVPRLLETAAVGAAIVAAVGIGAHPDLPTAIRAMTATGRAFEPDPARREVYDRAFEAYLALHPAISPVLRGLAA
jgi:xylulokinase